MTEVLPVTAPEALHGADSEPTLQQCNEVFESDEDLGIIAEAVFGDSSEEEYAKTSDDDTPRSAVPSDAPKIVGVDKSNDLLQKEDKDSKKMQDPCVDPISNDTPSSIEGIRAPVANPRVVHQPQQQVQTQYLLISITPHQTPQINQSLSQSTLTGSTILSKSLCPCRQMPHQQ